MSYELTVRNAYMQPKRFNLTISEEDVEGIIRDLKKRQFIVDRKASRKVVSYRTGNEEPTTVRVPLSTRFPSGIDLEVESYIFNEKGRPPNGAVITVQNTETADKRGFECTINTNGSRDYSRLMNTFDNYNNKVVIPQLK